MNFNPQDHLKKLSGKEYLEVKWRLVWFHQETGPRAGYVTVEMAHDQDAGFAKFFTIAWDGKDETWRHVKINGIEVDVCGRIATGEGSETRADFRDFYEKASTKSLGRALGGLGFGTQFSPEMDEGERVADSPVERKQPQAEPQRPTAQPQKPAQPQAQPAKTPEPAPLLREVPRPAPLPDDGSPATEDQRRAVRSLCDKLGREAPAMNTLTFITASALIAQLNREVKAGQAS